MNVEDVNQALLAGNLDLPGLFPRLEALQKTPAVFRFEFGLEELPLLPGVILIRGARQYGKSTWLESAIRDTVRQNGPGTALFLDGDYLRDADHLASELSRLATVFRADAPVRRLFVDEITSVAEWERALKRVLDRGELRRVLVITTGSKATNLRRGTERLPGRKGKLDRTTYLSFRSRTPSFCARAATPSGIARLPPTFSPGAPRSRAGSSSGATASRNGRSRTCGIGSRESVRAQAAPAGLSCR